LSESPARTEATARTFAFEILKRVANSGAWASVLLERRERELTDAREAGLLHELVLGILRRQRALDHAIDSVASRPAAEMDPDVSVALRIGAYSLLYLDRVPDFAAVDSAVGLVAATRSRGRTGFVNAVLRALSRRGPEALPGAPVAGDVPSLARFHSFPDWWVTRLVDRLGWDTAEAVLSGSNRPAEVVLHVDLARNTPPELAQRLETDGIQVEAGRLARNALRVVDGRLGRTRAVEEGLAWVQDEAAQLVTEMFGETVGPKVADLCAAPGGKTLHLAQGLVDGGVVVAIDRHAGRMRRLKTNVLRHAGSKVVLAQADVSGPHLPLEPGFQQVLVDAPCSGTGTLRRHPEIRWRLGEDDPKLLAVRQRGLLAAAADIVVPGGSVVYSVCSMEPEEGSQVVRHFLASRADFEVVDPRPHLSIDARDLVSGAGFLETSPVLRGLDGFFAARLRKIEVSR
jgi:16S rRNA (cytosine967-C5)-methyltransferase